MADAFWFPDKITDYWVPKAVLAELSKQFFERAKKIRIFFELGQHMPPIADRLDVEPIARDIDVRTCVTLQQ